MNPSHQYFSEFLAKKNPLGLKNRENMRRKELSALIRAYARVVMESMTTM